MSLACDKDPVFATSTIVAAIQKRKQACRDTFLKPNFGTSTPLLTDEIVVCCKNVQIMEFVWFVWSQF